VVVLPALGAKLASLRHIPSGREWLVQPSSPLVPRAYGSSFVGAEMCGWDELLPTIDPCFSPDTGAPLPDHGEVWAIPWRVERADAEGVTTVVDGVALEYRLRRRLVVSGPALRLEYELAVTGDRALSLLWAAHPQFACLPGTAVRLEASVREAFMIHPGPPRNVLWPEGGAIASELRPGTSQKVYVQPDSPVAEAEIADPDGSHLRLAWDGAHVPYLGVWLDNAQFSREPVAALEPATGFYDNLERAAAAGRVTRIAPGEPLAWTLEVVAA
jgi:galactose mutarotase-like enzyme